MTIPVDAAGAATVLARHREVTVLCHVRPDADALGSAAGLARALRRDGAAVHQSFDPGAVPDGLRVIPGTELVLPLADVPAHDGLVVALDCASAERVGAWDGLVASASEVLVVDHHRSNPGFGTHMLLDPDAASTASLVLEVLEAGDRTVDAETATALYAGLVTDTGSFRWAGAAAHATARRLVSAGAKTTTAFELLDAHSFPWLRVLGELLGRARLEGDAARGRGAVWLEVPYDIVSGASEDDVESLVSHLRGVRESVVSVLLKEFLPGEWAVSLRSRDPDLDVAEVATMLGGGGHAAAAGCTVRGDAGAVAARIRDLLG